MATDVPQHQDEGWLPGALAPLEGERARIERILARLDVADTPVERADLGSELVRNTSRYEDTLERAVFASSGDDSNENIPGQLEHLATLREQLREPMSHIHEMTMHVDPRNVHAHDPESFENALAETVRRLRNLLAAEDTLIFELVDHLDAEAADRLSTRVAHTFRHASERPRPPKSALGRLISNAHVKLDHTLEDVATPQHPGAETIDG